MNETIQEQECKHDVTLQYRRIRMKYIYAIMHSNDVKLQYIRVRVEYICNLCIQTWCHFAIYKSKDEYI